MSVAAGPRFYVSGTTSESRTADGQIQLILGPMFSGKTSELIRRVRRYKQYQKCLMIAYQGDTRYSTESSVTTHDFTAMKAKSVTALSEVENAAHAYSVIGIDEGQFFPGMLLRCDSSLVQADGYTILKMTQAHIDLICPMQTLLNLRKGGQMMARW